MAPKLKNRIAPCRKLLRLRSLANSRSVRSDSIVMDSIFYILQLKSKFEAMKKEFLTLLAIKKDYLQLMQLIQHPQNVQVKRTGNKYMVKVTCEKGKDKLVSVLEAFEEMGLAVLQAEVSSNSFFSMEAVAVVHEHDQDTFGATTLDVGDVTQALYNAIGKKGKEAGTCG